MSPFIDDNGEVGKCPACQRREAELDRKDDIITGLQRDIRTWTLRYADLKRDKEASAKNHPLYGDAEIAFKEWRKRCHHPRSVFTADRFWQVVPFLDNKKYGLKIVLQAIAGAEYDPFKVRRKNGTTKVFDEWSRVFKNADSVEDFASRAPGMSKPNLKAVA